MEGAAATLLGTTNSTDVAVEQHSSPLDSIVIEEEGISRKLYYDGDEELTRSPGSRGAEVKGYTPKGPGKDEWEGIDWHESDHVNRREIDGDLFSEVAPKLFDRVKRTNPIGSLSRALCGFTGGAFPNAQDLQGWGRRVPGAQRLRQSNSIRGHRNPGLSSPDSLALSAAADVAPPYRIRGR